jgi:RNA polymerase sigma-70 factor (ECF subfamily)
MAAVLDIPPGTVKSRLFRGRELLKAQIVSLEGDAALHDSTIGDLDRWAKSMRRVLDANADADE